MSKNMLRNRAFLRDSLEVISDWRLLTFCSVILLRNTVLMFLQKNLQTCFDVPCYRRSDRTRKTTNVTTYKQYEPSIILLVDQTKDLINLRWFMIWHRQDKLFWSYTRTLVGVFLQISARFSLAMTVPFPNTLLCSNQMNKLDYLGMICKSSFVSANQAFFYLHD